MNKTKNILIISSNRLGDSIMSSGLHQFFKKEATNKITLVCGKVPSELFKYCENIDHLITLNKRKFAYHWFLLWFKLIFIKWEYIIDLRGTGISLFLFSKYKYIYKKKNQTKKNHKVEEITKSVTGKIINPSIKINSMLNFKDDNLREILKLRKNHKLIMIAPTANWIGKTWPSERFLELVYILHKQPYFRKSLFLFVGPANEKYLVRNILEKKKNYILDLFGKSTLIEIFNIMKHCNLFIGNDSGLMHMAALANIKTFGLFGPSDKFKYKPWGKGNIVISSTKTPHELMGYEGFDSKKCGSLMMDIKTQKVFENVMKNLVNDK